MPLAARISDDHACPKVEPPPHVGGPIVRGSSNVLVEDLPAARAKADYTGDFAICAAGGPDYLAQGCTSVLFNDMHACRVGDMTQHGGVIAGHAATVEIGVAGDARTVLPIEAGSGSAASAGAGTGQAAPSGTGDVGPPGDDANGSSDRQPGAEEPGETYPEAVIVIDREYDGPFVEGEELTLRSASFDREVGTYPDAGIISHTWDLQGPGGHVHVDNDRLEPPQKFVLSRQGVYAFSLLVRDADGNPDQATVNVTVGTRCVQYKEELDELEANIKAWISDNAGSWRSRMLEHYMEGNGKPLLIEPSHLRFSAADEAQARSAGVLLRRKVIAVLRRLPPGSFESGLSGWHSVSFNANPVFNPDAFFASGGSILTTQMSAEAGRGQDSFYVHADFSHEWYDHYNWDADKGYYWIPNSRRWTAGIRDQAFVLLKECRGKGNAFDMRTRWYHRVHFRCPDNAAARLAEPDLWQRIWDQAEYWID